MKVGELRQLTREELEQKEAHFLEELFNLRFQRVTGKLENPSRIREVRRTIARIKTIKRQLTANS
ncbi:50S ribosomal protein L29 [candidate division NPL-UPA2 bacterium]|nr:50S ribosomal protein L29 [candidate division NPL-UPA2 bacterium]